ncbi:uncharacterized protein OCT59_011225 [Rhizophagus irregularis]|uniref:Skm1p n=3 Tax=Rhizophagus irregularis TaxID=588596 RepID=A0A015MDX8_RHIIW|nr:Skm1p [Rhizophagus irregularis DAOM 197198w]UZO19963.1 hypothetical protein OCT59_011225 [Rhizophagus irregularis]GBC23638.1 kinase-like domain-containing protein [Rhizophagus irregularis DAOM 181602=DAOM 197198]
MTIRYKANNNKIIFETSDYDLDKDERRVKYEKYGIIICEKCKEKFNRDWHCRKCFNNETDEEKNRMLHGRCNGCSQVMKIHFWCPSCNSKRFQRDFINWTSGNDDIDNLIKDIQTSAYSKHILEWIPYNKFIDVHMIDSGGFAKVYSAIWRGGRIEKWDQEFNNWKRSGSFQVALKVLNDSNNLSEDFLNELKFLKKFPTSYYSTYVVECFGITQEPSTLNYALVLKLKEGSLRSYLDKKYKVLTLKDKLDIISKICMGLDCVHNHNIIHRDLHLGNILYTDTDKKKLNISISDFGFCKPAFETSNLKEKNKLFGVMPYMAPEVWNGKGYTKKSDIYSFGIIINEIISGCRPYHNIPHDYRLAIEICRGLRPEIRSEIPEALKILINKCLDAIPENRPNTYQIYTMLQDFMYTKNDRGSYNFKKHTEQYEELKESSHIATIIITKDSPSGTREDVPQIKYKSKLLDFDFPKLPASINSDSFIIKSDVDSNFLTVPKGHSTCSDCIIENINIMY